MGGCKTKCHSWSKVIIRNQRVVDCSSCRMRYHIKCGGLSVKDFKKMRLVGNQAWICHKFIFNVLPSHVCSPSTDSMESSDNEPIDMPEIINLRQRDSRGLIVLHLNVNSLQNKLEEVKILIDDFKAQVVFLTETKTDSSYPVQTANSSLKVTICIEMMAPRKEVE